MAPSGWMAPYSPIMIGLAMVLRGKTAGTSAASSCIDCGTGPVLRAQTTNSSYISRKPRHRSRL